MLRKEVELRKVRRTETALALASGKFDQVIGSVGNSVSTILNRPNIRMLAKAVDPLALEIFLAAQIQKLTENVNIDQRLNIQAHQIPIIAGQLIELYPVESLEDFVLCFKRGATGFYGSIFRLDAAVLNEWMRAYLEEKYSAVETEKAKQKMEADAGHAINYEAYKERLAKQAAEPPPLPSNVKDNEYQRYKLERNRKIEFQKKLHRESSEFYAKQGKTGFEVKVFNDESGFEILAENETDALEIYKIATERK